MFFKKLNMKYNLSACYNMRYNKNMYDKVPNTKIPIQYLQAIVPTKKNQF